MNDYKTCKNGHHFQSNLTECPYCPKPNYIEETIGFSTVQQEDEDKTQNFNATGYAASNVKTQIFSPGANKPPQKEDAVKRKLVGWLVTFSKVETGQDFRIFEGRNSVGSDSKCDVNLSFDGSISAHHVTILFRLGDFLFKDELSTNGTFINGKLKNEGYLNDADEIKIGNTVLLFKKALK